MTTLQDKIQELRRVQAALNRMAAPTADWADGDPRAPKTPWGPAQVAYNVAPGAVWFSTAGHGGLRVSPATAKKALTPAAIKLADKWGGSLWFEEDIGYTIPFYENYDWAVKYDRMAGGRSGTQQDLERTVRLNFPQYFRMREENFVLPAPPKVGDSLLVLKDIPYGHRSVPAGVTVPIIEVKRTRVVFRYDEARWGLSFDWIDRGYAELKPSGLRAATTAGIQRKELPGGWVLTWNPTKPSTIYVDGDDWSDSALKYRDGRIVYDFPERIPPAVKGAVEKFFKDAPKLGK